MINSLGQPLTEADYQKLESESWIPRELADAAGIFRVNSQEGANIVGRKNNKDYAGIVFPYFWPGEASPRDYRLRRDHPEIEYSTVGTQKEVEKYLTAPGSGNKVYIPPGLTAEIFADTSLPIVITEGEKKTLALWRVSNFDSDSPRFLPMGLPGANNWKGKIGREPGPDGTTRYIKGVIPDLGRINWKRRTVTILYDSDASTKYEVRSTRRGLAHELEGRQ
jgi:hypothetical protein